MTAGAFYMFREVEELDKLAPGMVGFLRHAIAERGTQFVQSGDYVHPKTPSQNDMFRGLAREVAEFWNANRAEKTSADAVARDLKITYGVIVTEYSPVTGKRGARPKSTADYTKSEMAALITSTLAWAATEGIPLRDPRA